MIGNGSYLYVRNWQQFQHYKTRSPAWIKLYRSLLSDYAFRKLPDKSKLDLILIWVLAANNEGSVPTDRQYLKSVLGLSRIPNVDILIKQGFLSENASILLAQRREEKIREEKIGQKLVDKSLEKAKIVNQLPRYLYKQPTEP